MYHILNFYDSLSRFGLADAMHRAGCVIAAYSGGADSACLLRHLHHWCTDNGVMLAAVHVNHGIRGADADRDEAFCRETCQNLRIPLHIHRENVPDLARRTGRGLEETARAVRYEVFDRLSAEYGNAPVATAHNADDNLETVLFHLLRGSGSRGLSGIDPLRDGRFLRPLIADSGAEIRRWCADCQVPYVTDATNADTEYTRNFIRHTIVPQMEHLCDHPQRTVLRMTTLLRQDNDCLDQLAAGYAADGAVSIERTVLNTLHPAVASRVLLRLYSHAAQALSVQASLEECHIREILRLTSSDATDAALSLPGAIRFAEDRHIVRFLPEPPPAPPSSGEVPIVFTYPADGNVFENERYVIKFSQDSHANNVQEDENIYKLFICRTFCFDKIRNVLHIRYRRPGDTYVFGGMTRKIKKLFIDQKLTGDEKASLPLICEDTGDILWVPLFPPRDGTQANNGEPGLTIVFYEKKTT